MPFGAVINETSPDYEIRVPQWRKVRDCLEGEEMVKDAGTFYLPKPRGMKKIDYMNYIERACFYAVSDRTLRGLVGLVFRVDPVIKLPPKLKRMLTVASPEGFTMSELVREALREILSMGRYGLLVDLPTGATTDSVPYIATWKAEEIVRWEERVDLTSGLRSLSRVVVIEEPADTEDITLTYMRELYIDPEDGTYKQQRWVETTDQRSSQLRRQARVSQNRILSLNFEKLGDPIQPKKFNQPLKEIPFYFANVFDTRARTDKPPMLDLANVNLAHYRNSADYEMALHIIGSPTPYVFGIRPEDRPTTLGPTQVWHSTAKDVKAGMLEYTGQGVATIRLAMKDKTEQMAVLGARLIRGEDRENKTAETTRLEAREETSVLLAGVRTVEQVFERASRFAASWVGASEDEVDYMLNRDFVETRLTAEELLALVKSWQGGAISDEVYHMNLQRGEIMPADRELAEEKAARDREQEERAAKTADQAAEAAKKLSDAVPPKPPAGGGAGA